MEKSRDLNPTPTVEVLYPSKALLGESPFYEEETGLLLWVDVKSKTINFLDPITGNNRAVQCSDEASAVIGVESSSKLLAVLWNKICLVDRDSGAVLEELCSVEDDKPDNRINDAKCDSSGRVWFGTMAKDPTIEGLDPGAGFYSYFRGEVQRHDGVIASNGLGWNLADNTMYYIDTCKKSVYSYSYDHLKGLVSDRKVFIDYAQDPELGMPDGMCTDHKGRLWVASIEGGRVMCWDPQTKERVLTVKIPGVKNVTSCCFGGPNYEWLFVTSATFYVSKEDLKVYPNCGLLFVIKDLGTRGLPAHKFKVNSNY